MKAITIILALGLLASSTMAVEISYGVRNDVAGPVTDGGAMTLSVSQPLGWWAGVEPMLTISDKAAPSALLVFAPADFGIKVSPTVGGGYVRSIDGNRWAMLVGCRLSLPFSSTEHVWLGYTRALSFDDDTTSDLVGFGVSVGL